MANKILLLLCFSAVLTTALSQDITSTYTYHPPSEDKLSWQKLNLLLSSTYILVAKEGQIDIDSCLLRVSRSLGLSRLAVLAEGIGDTELIAQSQWVDQGDVGKGIHILSQSAGKRKVEVLLLLGAYYAFQPQRYRHRDSIEYYLNKAITESKALKEEKLGRQALCLLGKMYVQVNDKTNSESVFRQLIRECELAGDKETEARAFAYRGIYSPVSAATVQNKIIDLQKAAELYHTLNAIEDEINALTDIGYLLVITSQLKNSYDAFLKALQLAESIHYPYIHYITEDLAMVTMFEGKFGEPFKYVLETIRISEKTRDSIGWANFYHRLSTMYSLEGGKKKEVFYWAQKAVNRFLQDNDPMLYLSLHTMLIVMNSEGRKQEALDLITEISKKIPPETITEQFLYHNSLSECYRNLRQFESSKKHLIKADSLETKAEAIRGPLRRWMIHMQYGLLHYNQGQYLEARSSLEKYFSGIPAEMAFLESGLIAYRNLIELDSILNDPVSEVAHYKRYVKLLDSNFQVSKFRQAEELGVMYKIEEKENQISLLNQQATLKQTNLEQATLVKNLTIAGIIAALIIAALLYRQSRLRKKNNKIVIQKNAQLQHFLNEKEWLLKEIHHRVKNNLQIVMSLLNSQSAYIDNDAALTAIHDSQHRVHAMSLIHQKLYNTDNVSSIDMSLYIRELVSYLNDSFDKAKSIRFDLNVEPILLDVSRAVPLGLILNEAITNSLKYAFPENGNGTISITLSGESGQQYLLIIADNGVGIPTNFSKTGSLGISLIKGLAEDLEGTLSIESKGGTVIKLFF